MSGYSTQVNSQPPSTLYDGSVTRFLGKIFLSLSAIMVLLLFLVVSSGTRGGGGISPPVAFLSLIWLFFAVGFGIAGIVNLLVGIGLRSRARERVIGVLTGYGHVNIRRLAEELNVTESSLVSFVNRCLKDGTVRGRLDPYSREFYSEAAYELSEFVSFVKAYRRIKLSDLAHKLEVTEYEAETRLKRALQQRLLAGYIDRQTNEFITHESLAHIETSVTCPNCGAPEEQVVLRGETRQCAACGSSL